jgi:glycosyltransferase involved in cell wall biosynthesis
LATAEVKVLHVYRTYFPDGASGMAESIRQICLSTKTAGVESAVFALSPNPQPTFLDREEARIGRAKSYAAPASCDLGGPDAFRLFSQMASEADVINYHFPWPFADLLHLTMRPKGKTVMTWHSDIVRQKWLGRLYAPLMNRMISRMDALVATSPTYASTSPVLSQSEIAQRVHTIPLGIDETSLPAKANDEIFPRLSLSPDEPYFLFVGATRYYKGLHFLIEAATEIPAKIVIAGAGPELEELKQFAKRFPAARIVFAGRVTDEEKVALLQHCRAFVLPSHVRSEAYGMVLVEASIYAKPMVTCEIGSGTSYVNLDGETGFVVEPANPNALANALNRFLDDPTMALEMGRAARRRYEQLFTGRAMGDAYAKLYESLLQPSQVDLSPALN